MVTVNPNCNDDLVSTIYNRYATDLKMYFLSYTHDVMKAEDMLHDLFLKVLSLDTIMEDTAHSLIFLMAKRAIINDVRHKAYVRNYEKQALDSNDYYDDSLARRIEARQIFSIGCCYLRIASPKRAEVYQLYRELGFSTNEIADQLNLSKRTVESHVYLASKEIKSYLSKII